LEVALGVLDEVEDVVDVVVEDDITEELVEDVDVLEVPAILELEELDTPSTGAPLAANPYE